MAYRSAFSSNEHIMNEIQRLKRSMPFDTTKEILETKEIKEALDTELEVVANLLKKNLAAKMVNELLETYAEGVPKGDETDEYSLYRDAMLGSSTHPSKFGVGEYGWFSERNLFGLPQGNDPGSDIELMSGEFGKKLIELKTSSSSSEQIHVGSLTDFDSYDPALVFEYKMWLKMQNLLIIKADIKTAYKGNRKVAGRIKLAQAMLYTTLIMKKVLEYINAYLDYGKQFGNANKMSQKGAFKFTILPGPEGGVVKYDINMNSNQFMNKGQFKELYFRHKDLFADAATRKIFFEEVRAMRKLKHGI